MLILTLGIFPAAVAAFADVYNRHGQSHSITPTISAALRPAPANPSSQASESNRAPASHVSERIPNADRTSPLFPARNDADRKKE